MKRDLLRRGHSVKDVRRAFERFESFDVHGAAGKIAYGDFKRAVWGHFGITLDVKKLRQVGSPLLPHPSHRR